MSYLCGEHRHETADLTQLTSQTRAAQRGKNARKWANLTAGVTLTNEQRIANARRMTCLELASAISEGQRRRRSTEQRSFDVEECKAKAQCERARLCSPTEQAQCQRDIAVCGARTNWNETIQAAADDAGLVTDKERGEKQAQLQIHFGFGQEQICDTLRTFRKEAYLKQASRSDFFMDNVLFEQTRDASGADIW
jgi:hypothetical protein